mgnify:CR=1 FL=1
MSGAWTSDAPDAPLSLSEAMARSVVRLARPTASAISETVIEGFSAMRLRMLFLSPSSRRSSVQKGSIASRMAESMKATKAVEDPVAFDSFNAA